MEQYYIANVGNAFGSTFAFFPTAQNQTKKCKRATNPTQNESKEKGDRTTWYL